MTEAERRIRRALHAIDMMQGSGKWSLVEIRHILEGAEERP